MAGQVVSYIATVSATNSVATPTGYVTFSDGNTVIGTSTLSGGLAIVSTTPTVAGAHTISATYTPSANFQPSSTDAPWTQQVNTGAATQVLFGQQPTFSFVSTQFNPTVSAYFADSYGNLVSGPGSMTIALAGNPTGAALAGLPTEPVINGVATFPDLSLNRPGTGYTLSITSQGLTGATSSPFTIGSATHFILSAPATVQGTANGASFNLTVTAATASNTLDGFYQGTVSVTATNGTTTLTLLPGYTFASADRGRHTFTGLQLPSPGRWTITATDSRKATVVGRTTVTVTVAPSIVLVPVAPATHLSVAAATNEMTNAPFNVRVSALTASNRLAPQYQGTVIITATSGPTTLNLVASYTFTAVDKGGHFFTGLTLPTGGRWTIAVSDVDQPTVAGQAIVTAAVPPPATHFSVSPPRTVMTNAAFSLTVAALTVANRLASWYQGTVAITATNGTTTIPLTSYTFAATDNGRQVFSGMELSTAGRWTITVADANNAAVLGRAVLPVTAPPPATHFGVTASISGAGFNLTVTALTASNALAAQYPGSVLITATNGMTTMVLLPSYTFTTADNGRHVCTGLELPFAGQWTITVSDVDTPTLLGRTLVTVAAPTPVVSSDPTTFTLEPLSCACGCSRNYEC
jgi:hypothetical protein